MHALLAIEEAATDRGNPVLAGILMAAGVLIITTVMMMRLWRIRRRNAASAGVPLTERITKIKKDNAADGVGRMEAVMVEMQELTRVCAAQVENRVARLEMLLREADDRIAQLTALEEDAERAAPPAPAPAGRPTPVVRPSIGSDELSQRVYALADSGLGGADIARELGEHTGKVELILALRTESRRSGAGATAG